MTAMWKPIPGYRFPYRINEEAEVERQISDGSWRKLNPFLTFNGKKTGGILCVNLRVSEKAAKRVSVTSLMEGRWLKKRKPGEFYYHLNGCATDCSGRNIEIRNRRDMPWNKNGTHRRSVIKIDENGNELEVYKSVSDAARKNNMSRKSITMRCTGKTRRPFYLTGFSFRYEDRRENK